LEGLIRQEDSSVISPFGPCIGKVSISQNLVDLLLSQVGKSGQSFGTELVGKIKKQPEFSEADYKAVIGEVGSYIINFFVESFSISTMGKCTINPEQKFNIKYYNGWYVDMVAGEYNPTHHHVTKDSSQFSTIGFLQVPVSCCNDGEDYLDGTLNFFYGEHRPNCCSQLTVSPVVGDFYVFDNHLTHCVYPFKGDGNRISFSMNLGVEAERENKEGLICLKQDIVN